MLADDLAVPFVELNRVIERLAGCDVREIHALYGASAYRRYELRALEETVAEHSTSRDRDRRRPRGGTGDVRPAAGALLHRVAARDARRAHEARDRAGRHAADGGQRRSDGRSEAHPRRPRGVLREGRPTFDTSGKPLAESYLALRAAVTAAAARRGLTSSETPHKCIILLDVDTEYALLCIFA